MDHIRICYKSSMRIYSDRPDILVPGRWHWCPEGALPVPYPHVFGSSSYATVGMEEPPDLGEPRAQVQTIKGVVLPRYLGVNVCGDAEHWLSGGLFAERGTPAVDDDGVPVCCVAAPIGDGGDEVDGSEAATAGGGDLDGGGTGQVLLTGGGDLDSAGALQLLAGGGDLDSASLVPHQTAGGGDLDGGGTAEQTAGGGDLDGSALQDQGDVGAGDVDSAGAAAAPDVLAGDVDSAGAAAAPDVLAGDVDSAGAAAAPDVLAGDLDSAGTVHADEVLPSDLDSAGTA